MTMKAVLISIQPKWVEKIANGEKTIEVRKTAPKQVPFKGYIYCTKSTRAHMFHLYINDGIGRQNFGITGHWRSGKKVVGVNPHLPAYRYNSYLAEGKVIGEFVCDKAIKTCGWRLRGDTQQCAKRTTDEETFPELACLTIDDIVKYAGSENREVCGLHITDLKIYDKPKELSEFERPCSYKGICYSCKRFRPNGIPLPAPYGFCEAKITRVPSNWQYVEEL